MRKPHKAKNTCSWLITHSSGRVAGVDKPIYFTGNLVLNTMTGTWDPEWTTAFNLARGYSSISAAEAVAAEFGLTNFELQRVKEVNPL